MKKLLAVAFLATLAAQSAQAASGINALIAVTQLKAQSQDDEAKETPPPSQKPQSKATKRLEDHRNSLRRNWGG